MDKPLALPCIKCEKPLVRCDRDYDQPYGGTEFTTTGHYGSTIHDATPWEAEATGETPLELVVNICDTCILRAVEQNVIQSRGYPTGNEPYLAHHHLDEKQKAWVLAQNERHYGSAWGEDQPVDYREQMLLAGWSKELLDKEES